jgi:hypothetical protein
MVFVALLALLHRSSLDGFYEAEVWGEQLWLHCLIATGPEAVSLRSLREIGATPVFRRLWCLCLAGP